METAAGVEVGSSIVLSPETSPMVQTGKCDNRRAAEPVTLSWTDSGSQRKRRKCFHVQQQLFWRFRRKLHPQGHGLLRREHGSNANAQDKEKRFGEKESMLLRYLYVYGTSWRCDLKFFIGHRLLARLQLCASFSSCAK